MMLITGFEGYGGRGLNPAAEIANTLNGTKIAGCMVKGVSLPVQYAGLADRLEALINQYEPRAMICLGLWPGEAMIRLERVAININDFEIADNEGLIEKGPIKVEGVGSRMSSLPLDEIQTRLLKAGIPARISSSAGNFLCNATMYTALGVVENSRSNVPCGFIHVPYLPAQVAELVATLKAEQVLELHQRADVASMSLETAAYAIEIAAQATLEAVT